MANREAVFKEIVDRVFPAINPEWELHWQEIQKNELNRKNLIFLVHLGLESQSSRLQEELVNDFYKAFFPNRA